MRVKFTKTRENNYLNALFVKQAGRVSFYRLYLL